MSEFAPVAYTSETRVSRRPHKCCECGGVIFYKEMYHYFSGCWDGSWATYKTCTDCEEFRDSLRDDTRDEDPPGFGELWSEITCYTNYKLYVERYIDVCDRRGVKVRPNIRKLIR